MLSSQGPTSPIQMIVLNNLLTFRGITKLRHVRNPARDPIFWNNPSLSSTWLTNAPQHSAEDAKLRGPKLEVLSTKGNGTEDLRLSLQKAELRLLHSSQTPNLINPAMCSHIHPGLVSEIRFLPPPSLTILGEEEGDDRLRTKCNLKHNDSS